MNEMTPQECTEVLESVEKYGFSAIDGVFYDALKQSSAVMRKLVTSELVEVVHAKWNYTTDIDTQQDIYICSHCGGKSYGSAGNYCFNCGADMGGKDDNNAE